MIGAIIGDVVGSRFEFHNIKTKDFELWHNDCHTTDDSVLTCATADWVLHGGHPEKYLLAWGRRYKDQRFEDGKISAFSPGFTKWLETKQAYNANTNGCIMRMSPVPIMFDDYDKGMSHAIELTSTTHNHPESLTATGAYIDTAYMLKLRTPVPKIKEYILEKYNYNLYQTLDDIRPTYNKFYYTCKNSVPMALIAALDANDFVDAIRGAISIGGDSDTLACIAGGLAEIRFGVPHDYAVNIKKYMDGRMQKIVNEFYTKLNSKQK